jgi:hypothetical protein
MLGEEKALLMSRSTSIGVGGNTATAATSSTVTTGSGITGGTVTTVLVVFYTGLGRSQAIAATGLTTLTTGHGVDVTLSGSAPAGTLAIETYVEIAGTPTWYKGVSTHQRVESPRRPLRSTPARFPRPRRTTVPTRPTHWADRSSPVRRVRPSPVTTDSSGSHRRTAGTPYVGATLSTSSPGTEFYTGSRRTVRHAGRGP